MRVDAPVGGVVLTHPHPLFGGDRFNPIIDTLFGLLPEAGFTTVRFDFRGVNESSGVHDDGDSERLDVLAAVELLEFAQPDSPTWLVGYSFGSVVALNVVDPRVSGWVTVAPPLAAVAGRVLASTDHRPKLLLVPSRDQFSPPETAAPIIEAWANTAMRPIDGADHFLSGHVQRIADDIVAHLTRQRRR